MLENNCQYFSNCSRISSNIFIFSPVLSTCCFVYLFLCDYSFFHLWLIIYFHILSASAYVYQCFFLCQVTVYNLVPIVFFLCSFMLLWFLFLLTSFLHQTINCHLGVDFLFTCISVCHHIIIPSSFYVSSGLFSVPFMSLPFSFFSVSFSVSFVC